MTGDVTGDKSGVMLELLYSIPMVSAVCLSVCLSPSDSVILSDLER